MCREVLLSLCGDATRRRANLLNEKGKADTARRHKKDRYFGSIALRNRQYTARRLKIGFQHAIGQRIPDQTTRHRLYDGDLGSGSQSFLRA